MLQLTSTRSVNIHICAYFVQKLKPVTSVLIPPLVGKLTRTDYVYPYDVAIALHALAALGLHSEGVFDALLARLPRLWDEMTPTDASQVRSVGFVYRFVLVCVLDDARSR
jgi:hypothetical protein